MDDDALRLFFLGLGGVAGSLYGTRHPVTARHFYVGRVYTLLGLLFFGVLFIGAPYGFRTAFFSGVTGFIVGVFIADDRRPRRAGGLTGVAASLLTAVLCGILLIFALLPSEMRGLLQRLQGFEAAGLKFTLGPAGGNALAEAIRGGRISGDTVTQSSAVADERGFAVARFETLKSLSFPPEGSGLPTLLSNPSAALFVAWSPNSAVVTRGQQTRHAARDRAYIAMQLWAQKRPPGGQPQFRAPAPPDLHPAFRAVAMLGQPQEMFLLRLSNLYDCMSGYVRLTKDTRIIRSEVDGFVHSLHAFAQLWSALEFDLISNQINETAWPGRLSAALTSAALLFERADRLQYHLAAEVELGFPPPPYQAISCERVPVGLHGLIRRSLMPLGPTFAEVISKLESPARSKDTETGKDYRNPPSESREPDRLAFPEFADRNLPLIEDISNIVKDSQQSAALRNIIAAGGATPYLSLAAAYSLSAIGAYDSAIDQLVAWLQKRDTLETQLRNRLPAGGAARISHDTLVVTALEWYRLQVAVEILLLTSASEKSAEAPPVSASAMSILVREIYPSTLKRLNENEALTQWRRSNLLRQCETIEYKWKQAFVSSYLSFAEESLKLRNLALTKPSDVTAEDLDIARLLIDIEPTCFSDIEPRDVQRLNQASRYVAASAILINSLVDADRRMNADRLRLAEQLDGILRIVINQSERSADAKDEYCVLSKQRPRPEFELACQLSRSSATETALAANARSLKVLLDAVRTNVR